MTPTLIFIYAEGCGACEQAKPHFKKLVEELPKWKTGLLDIDKPGLNLDFPVSFTPTLYFVLGDQRYATDPHTLDLNFTKANMRKWLEACVAKYKTAKGIK